MLLLKEKKAIAFLGCYALESITQGAKASRLQKAKVQKKGMNIKNLKGPNHDRSGLRCEQKLNSAIDMGCQRFRQLLCEEHTHAANFNHFIFRIVNSMFRSCNFLCFLSSLCTRLFGSGGRYVLYTLELFIVVCTYNIRNKQLYNSRKGARKINKQV